MSEMDLDTGSSGLRVGIEVEYPIYDPGNDDYLISRGNDSNRLQSEMPRRPNEIEGQCVYDGTVGLEVVSPRLRLDDIEHWYRDVIDYVEAEWNEQYHPVGLMKGGNTAGMHIHLSPLTREQAEALYRLSQTTWAKVLFCSSIANDGDSSAWPVFRGGEYCRMQPISGNHYHVVNHREGDHYEWRLPEPMAPEHLEILAKFLRAFEQDPDSATTYAQEILDDGDERITSIQRAEAVGMDFDETATVERTQAPDDPEDFFDEVSEHPLLPEVYRVDLDGDDFYGFRSVMSESYTRDILEPELEAGTVPAEIGNGVVVRADSLDVVTDNSLTDQVDTAIQAMNSGGSFRETEATNELKKIVKKKKQ